MNDPASRQPGAPAEEFTLRPEQPADEPFLFALYASTREEELALTGWDPPARRAFLDLQFKAMRRGYASMFPAADFSIISLGGREIGRLVVNRTAQEIRVVDVAFAPAHRNAGLGTRLMRQVCGEAARAAVPVRLSVLKTNRAVRFYQKLGFRQIGEAGPYAEMEWRAGRQG